jgi:hypothetical protein
MSFSARLPTNRFSLDFIFLTVVRGHNIPLLIRNASATFSWWEMEMSMVSVIVEAFSDIDMEDGNESTPLLRDMLAIS